MAYIKGYIFDYAKIQRLLEIPDDDEEKTHKIDFCRQKALEIIDRDTNPCLDGFPLGTKDRRVVITIAEGDDPVSLEEEKGTEPAYLKKLAEHVFSGPHVFKRAY